MTLLDEAAGALAAKQHGTFHLQQLPGHLLTRSAVRIRIDSGRWHRATRQVMAVSGTPDSWPQRLWIGHLEAGPDTLVSRRSASVLQGVPGFASGPVDILQPEVREERTTRSELHISSWIPMHHRCTVDGLPVTSVARTLYDLAAISSPKRRRRGLPYVHADRVSRAVDDALVRKLTTLDELAETLATLGKRGRPGTALMRSLLADLGEGHVVTESVLEDLFLSVIDANGLPRPVPQVSVGGTHETGRVDFLYREARVVVECDSRRHHFGRLDAEHDRWRDLELVAAGWVVVRVTWWQLVNEPDRFVTELRRVLEVRSRAAR